MGIMTGIEFNELPYERIEMKHILSLVKNPNLIIDVGANIGWWSISLAKNYPDCQILSYEPVKEIYKNLVHNIKLNNVKNIKPYNLGMLHKIGLREIYYYPTLPAASSFKNMQKMAAVKTKVLNATIDDLMKFPDFIKIDTEGSELYVLQGAEETLDLCHPIVMCEILRKWCKKWNTEPNDILKFMSKLGYKCLAVNRTLRPITKITDTTEETNFLFLKKK